MSYGRIFNSQLRVVPPGVPLHSSHPAVPSNWAASNLTLGHYTPLAMCPWKFCHDNWICSIVWVAILCSRSHIPQAGGRWWIRSSTVIRNPGIRLESGLTAGGWLIWPDWAGRAFGLSVSRFLDYRCTSPRPRCFWKPSAHLRKLEMSR